MLSRFLVVTTVILLLAPIGHAQTVRFNTNVGNFDMELNPDSDDNLQVLVDNLLAYVEAGRYNNTVINRAADNDDTNPDNDFVLQMGSFVIDSIFPPATSADLSANPIETFDPVTVDRDDDRVVDFPTESNTRGTVSLALSNGPNTGTSSFFVNLGDNSQLDSQGFVPFATIPDMSTIDLIMQLSNVDFYNTSSLTFHDIPMIDNGTFVYIEEAFVLGAVVAASAGEGSGSGALNAIAVPEPPALVLAVGALMVLSLLSHRGYA